jgi:Ca2+-binding EF-hand superfamily protein
MVVVAPPSPTTHPPTRAMASTSAKANVAATEGRRPPKLPPLKTGQVAAPFAKAPAHLPSDIVDSIAASSNNDSKQGRIETFLASRKPDQVFAMFDEDGSGALTLDEWDAALRELGVYLPEPAVLALFRRVDIDGDGYISMDEFVAMFHTILGASTGADGLGAFNPANLLQPSDAFAMFDNHGR